MNFEEFIRPKDEPEARPIEQESPAEEIEADVEETSDSSVELDVQKAVVESLAAEKAEQEERLSLLQRENNRLKSQNATLTDAISKLKAELEKVGDLLAKNSETALSNKLTLLERDAELSDRFEGETRDHVLEVIKEAQEKAEQEQRLRRAHVLEGVLMANEPNGTLAKKRAELNKLFVDNANILSGPVIDELSKRGISHKNGENYLLPSEILVREY